MHLSTKNDTPNSEGFYAAIFDSIGSPILIIDSQTAAILDANVAACIFYGYSHTDFIQKKIIDLAAIPEEEAWQRIHKIAAGEITRMTLPHRLANGEIREVDVDLGHGEFEGKPINIATIHDITLLKQAEEKLQSSETNYRLLFDNMREGFSLYEVLKDENGNAVDARILAANAAYELHTGLKPGGIIGKTILEVIPQTNLSQLEPYFNVAQTGASISREYFSTLFQRHLRTETFCPQPGQFAVIVEDITERKKAQATLQAAHDELELRVQERTSDLRRTLERLDLAKDAAKLGIWDWDIQKNELVWDQQMYALYGVKPEDFGSAYEAWLNGIYPDDRETSDQVSEQARKGTIPYDTEFRVLWLDGSTHWLKANGQVFWDEQGKPTRMLGVNYDITERKQAEKKLNESRFRVEMAIQGANTGTWEWNVQTGETIFNERWAQIVGYTLKELEPINIQTWVNLCHPDDLAVSDEQLTKYFSGETEAYECEVRMKHKDGSWVWVFDAGKVLEWAPDGAPLRMFGTHLDVTERKRLELELSESEQKYTTLFEKSSVPSLLFRLPEIIIENINEAFEEMSGYQRWDLLGKNVTDIGIAPPTQYAQTVAQFDEQGFITKGEVQLFTKSGEERTILLNITPVSLRNKPYTIATFVDITERKRLELELSESEQKYTTLFEKSSVPSLLFRLPEVYIENVNEAFEEMSGYQRWDLLGKNIADIGMVPQAQHDQTVAQFYAQGFITKREARLFTKSGEERTILLSVAPINFGNEPHAITTFTDITERKQTELKLAETNTALTKALRARDEFMAAMSHELRTPLTGILGLTEMLQATAADVLNEKQLNYVTVIEKNGHRLLDTVTNVMDYTQLQGGLLRPNIHLCSLNEVCHMALRKAEALANNRQQSIRYVIHPLEIKLNSDEKLLYKCLCLLLDNASKFTATGGEFGLKVTGQSETGLVELTIWDTGVGITDDNLPRLFKPFAQLDASLARQYEGTGLGLALVKSITELLGGTVSAQSTLGKGSHFTITLPWK